jgi:integrase
VVSVRGKTSKVRRGRTAVAHSDNIIGVLNEYKEASQHTNDNDLVFYSAREPDEETRPVDLSTNFKTFLKRCPFENREEGLRLSVDGKARTLYSLRHFFAIQRLQQNVNIYGLATSMGTGVTQIRNHYGRHISGDAFINELTKNESKTGHKAKGAAVRKLVDMVESGVLDEELAMEAFRRVAETR